MLKALIRQFRIWGFEIPFLVYKGIISSLYRIIMQLSRLMKTLELLCFKKKNEKSKNKTKKLVVYSKN